MRQRCRGLRGPELDLFFKVFIETVFGCDFKKRLSHKYNPSLPSSSLSDSNPIKLNLSPPRLSGLRHRHCAWNLLQLEAGLRRRCLPPPHDRRRLPPHEDHHGRRLGGEEGA